jgi:phosphoglycerate dehydrogenase-like enzyme
MTIDVLCLRPEADFARAGALPPAALRVAYRSPEDADVASLMKEARALVIPAVGPKLPTMLFERSSIQFVQVTGAGIDRLDVPALNKLGITLANVPGGSNSAVAEYVVAVALVLLRRLAWADAEIRAGNYAAFRARMIADNLSGLEGLLAGIVGLGTIGFAVAQAFHKMGCEICYYDPVSRDRSAADAIGAVHLSLDELLRKADIVSLHVPLSSATRGLIGPAQLAQMKATAVLIQASRGGVVHEAALADCLKSGHLSGVAVDVYSNEPPAAGNPLFSLEGDAARRLLLTPHVAGVTRQSAQQLMRAAWENVGRVLLEKELPLHLVN